MRKERVGFAMCGSFCTHEKVLAELEKLVQLYETVIPIASEISAFTDTRFGTSDDLMERLEDLTGHEVLCDIPSVEPIGPKGLLDVLVIAPATGNTIAKLAAGITDTAGYDGGQGPSAEREAGGDCHGQQRRPGGWRPEYRGIAGAEELLFRSLRAGTTPGRNPVPWWRTSPKSRRRWKPLCEANRYSRCCCDEGKRRGNQTRVSFSQLYLNWIKSTKEAC